MRGERQEWEGRVGFVIGGWEIFKVFLVFPGYDYNIH